MYILGKLAEYNDVITEVIQKYDYIHPELIPQYDITLPLLFTSLDRAHYQGTFLLVKKFGN